AQGRDRDLAARLWPTVRAAADHAASALGPDGLPPAGPDYWERPERAPPPGPPGRRPGRPAPPPPPGRRPARPGRRGPPRRLGPGRRPAGPRRGRPVRARGGPAAPRP